MWAQLRCVALRCVTLCCDWLMCVPVCDRISEFVLNAVVVCFDWLVFVTTYRYQVPLALFVPYTPLVGSDLIPKQPVETWMDASQPL